MATLVIDTAARFCAACIHDPAGDRIIAAVEEEIGRGHAERLMDVVAAVMDRAGAGFDRLDAIAVSIGPGSFTGVRAGVAAARGFALARGVPVFGATTLESLAEQARRDHRPDGPFAVAILGGRGQVFHQNFKADGAPLGASSAIAESALAEHVLPDGRLIVGDAGRLAGGHRAVIDRPVGDIASVARAAAGFRHAPTPLYLRGADAKMQTGFALPRQPEREPTP